MAVVRNTSKFASLMTSIEGESLQVNAGFHGKVEDKFLYQYDTSAIFVLEGPKNVKAKAVEAKLAEIVSPAVIDASASTTESESKGSVKSEFSNRK